MAQAVRIYIDDADGAIIKSLRALGSAGPTIAKRVFKQWAPPVVSRAVDLAPKRVGKLAARIHATRPSYRGGEVMMTIEADASIIQHEDMTLKHPNGGGPKFVERAVVEGIGTLGDSVMAGIVEAELAAGQ
jgi:hypothetical protein